MPKPIPIKREISIIERRLQSGSIFAASSQPIPLKEPDRWTLRIVNSQISDAHLWEMLAVKGWVYATPEDLAIDPHEIGFRIQDGRIVRGVHGHEVLMKMPKADYQAVVTEKDRTNRRNTFGTKALKDAVVSAAQQEPDGDRGATFLDRHLKSISVTDGYERVNLEE